MTKKRILSCLLAGFMVIALLSGCRKENPEESVETSAGAQITETVSIEPETETTEQETAESLSEYNITVPDFPFKRETFPIMDGSTASVPLGKAIASTLLSESMEEVEDLARFNRTTQSFRNLSYGNCDILVVGEPNAAVYQEMEENHFKYDLEEIATDALIFVVNEQNPVDNLTTAQIRDIYTGKITNWKEVGGNDAPIIPFQRNEGAGSQALIKKLIMGDTEMAAPPTELIIGSMGDLMEAVKNYDNSANALGYSVYYYANDMKMAKGLKILSVDGVEPCDETIRNREYPHLNAYYCVIPSEPVMSTEEEKLRAEGARVIFDWLSTEGGQNLVASMGYVSVMDTGKGIVNREALPGNNYTLIDGREPGEIEARDDYGTLIPYAGSPLYENEGDGEVWQAGNCYGFFDENGRIASAPLYSGVNVLSYYDGNREMEIYVPMYEVMISGPGREKDEYGYLVDVNVRYRLVSTDGRFVSEKTWAYVDAKENGILCIEDDDAAHFSYLDYEGNVLFTDADLEKKNPGLSEKVDYGWSGFSYYGDFYTVNNSEGDILIDADTLEIIGGPIAGIADGYDGLFAWYDSFSYDSQAHWGVINSELAEVIPCEYENCVLLQNGGIAATREGKAFVFDHEGTFLCEAGTATSIHPTGYGFVLYDNSREAPVTTYCDFTGKNLFVDTEAIWSECGSMPVITMDARLTENGEAEYAEYNEREGVYVYGLLSGEGYFIKDVDYVSPFYVMEGTAPIGYLMAVSYGYEDGEDDRYYVLEPDLSEMYEAGPGMFATCDSLSNEWYIVTYEDWESGKYSLYDHNLETVCENMEGANSITGGLITIQTDTVFRAMKPDGTEVFCYSLIHSLGD